MATMKRATGWLPGAARQPRHSTWIIIFSIALAVHGVIHLIGFVVNWRLAQLQGMPYRTTVLAGHLDLGTAGIHIVGLLWLLAALGFVGVGVGLAWFGRPWRGPIAAVAIFSLVLCILGWPDSAFGALIDVAILAALALGPIWTARGLA